MARAAGSLPWSAEAARYGRSMTTSPGVPRTAATVIFALAANVALDIAFDLHMLARWAIVLAVVLLAGALIEVRRRRSHERTAGPNGT